MASILGPFCREHKGCQRQMSYSTSHRKFWVQITQLNLVEVSARPCHPALGIPVAQATLVLSGFGDKQEDTSLGYVFCMSFVLPSRQYTWPLTCSCLTCDFRVHFGLEFGSSLQLVLFCQTLL